MRRSRVIAVGVAAIVCVLMLGLVPASAALKKVTIGNFYFKDDSTGSTSKVVVTQGDQIRFAVVEDAPTPHSAVVDGLFDSGALSLGDTYTTPVLNTVGTFLLYCKLHKKEGHFTTLVVEAAPTASPSPTKTSSSGGGSSGGGSSGGGSSGGGTKNGGGGGGTKTSSSPSSSKSPSGKKGSGTKTAAPVGVGKLPASEQGTPSPDPNSLAGILGHPAAELGPWTRSFGLSLLALPLLAAIAGFALWLGKRRAAGARVPEPEIGGAGEASSSA
ncbi:MAG: hypothetical protein HY240_07590 [Actinobacteria bacterium]|nr:hypothetical protein [Actinomycetota bacterium]